MTELVMAAEDPISAAQFAPGSSADYMQLFSNAGAWQQVAGHLTTFKLHAAFVANASDQQLSQVIAWAQQNHVALGLETGILPVTTPDQPGWGVEGYNGAVASQVARIKALGGTLSSLTMDEPFFFGQQWSGTNAAHNSTATLAAQAAGVISQLKQIFPALQVGDVEPIPYTQNLADWAAAFEQATGSKLSFLDADLDWNTAYQQPLADLAGMLRAQAIPYGVIYNGTAADTSNLAWTADAIAHFVQVEADPATVPDRAVFQTWNPYPTQLLDETSPGALTNAMLQYLQVKGVVAGTVSITSATLGFGNAIAFADPAGNVGEAARLYQAAFNRAPDADGLMFWAGHIQDGSALTDVAQGFIGSQEFARDYGGLNDSGFVVQLYENVLHRVPDASGLAFWNQALSGGTTHAQVLLGFSDSSENRANTAPSMHDGRVFVPNG